MRNQEVISKEILLDLYAVKRRSALEISKALRCSEHKINYWLLKYAIPKRSLSEAIYHKQNPDGDPFKINAVKTLENSKLLGLGLGIYWGEGHKKNKNSIKVGNTDPRLILNFIKFLVEIFQIKISKLRFGLQIFSDMPEKKVLDFWLKELKEFGITSDQFFKVTVTPHHGIGNYKEKSKYGVLTVYFNNSRLKKLIDEMLPM